MPYHIPSVYTESVEPQRPVYIQDNILYTAITMHTRNLIIAGVVLVLILGAMLAFRPSTTLPHKDDATVATSFYPIYFMTASIVGSTSTVLMVTPPDTEPHEYEPTPNALASIVGSALFIHSGAGLEPWAARVVALREDRGLPSLSLITEKNGIRHETAPEEDHATHAYDPHIWLSPARAAGLVAGISTALSATNPASSTLYAENAKTLTEQLSAIDTAYRTTLAKCATHTIVTDHDAFGYIAADYGLTTLAIRGISPEDEPTPRTLAEITEYVRKNKITHILTEELVSPAVAETIARETGAKTAQLATIEGLTSEDTARGATYLTKLRDNLAVLTMSLHCQ